MNDFTKEELENILLHMSISVGEDTWDECSINIPGLYSKIKSMIDNYCEHEWRSSISSATHAGLGVHVECRKCHAKPQLTR